jgi:hypothetical protein
MLKSPLYLLYCTMTIQEMHTAFNQGLQRINANAYDFMLSAEIDYWLNRAQERFIKDRAFITGDVKRIGFEGNQKRLDDIRTLIVQDFTDAFPVQEGAQWVQTDLPADYLYLVNVRADIHLNRCAQVTASDAAEVVPVRVVDNSEVHTMNRNPFAKSQIDSPLCTISENDIRVYQDGESFILKGILADYIRIPEDVDLSLSQDCELAEHTHQEIVDIAVKNVLEAIESPRYQTNSAEQLSSE